MPAPCQALGMQWGGGGAERHPGAPQPCHCEAGWLGADPHFPMPLFLHREKDDDPTSWVLYEDSIN